MPEPERPLPPHPSLEQQKKLAKGLLRAYRAGEPGAIARIRKLLPDKDRITLADAQFSIARAYGFQSWAALKAHIGSDGSDLPRSVHTDLSKAFEARDPTRLRSLIEAHPAILSLLDTPRFPFDAPALVHFAAADDLAMVDLLLGLGADPNQRSDWWAGGFHSLHSATGAVADRLLGAGATPDACAAANLDRPDLLHRMLELNPKRVHERGGDGQTPLHFARSQEVVDLLLRYGADLDACDIDHRSPPAAWMLQGKQGAGRFSLAEYLVERGASVDIFLATALGLGERVRTLLEEDPSRGDLRTGRGAYGEQSPGSFHIYTWTLGQHLTPLQVALQFDQREVLDVLRGFAGSAQRLVAACAQGRAREARALLSTHPALIDQLGEDELRALPDAGWAGHAAAVELMLSLGFDPLARGQDGGTVLHCAAWQGSVDCVEVALRHDRVRGTIEQRDAVHRSTALGWCCHGARYCANPEGDYPQVARLLIDAGAKPGPNLDDATDDVLAVIREQTEDG